MRRRPRARPAVWLWRGIRIWYGRCVHGGAKRKSLPAREEALYVHQSCAPSGSGDRTAVPCAAHDVSGEVYERLDGGDLFESFAAAQAVEFDEEDEFVDYDPVGFAVDGYRLIQ